MPPCTPGSDEEFRLLIDGEAVVPGATIPVRNPATGEVFAQAPAAGAAELDRAVAAATKAFPGWRDTPMAARKAALLKASSIIDAHAGELALLFTREQGRPLPGAETEIRGRRHVAPGDDDAGDPGRCARGY